METFNNKDHWENLFATKAENEVSWYQPIHKTSIAFLETCNLPLDANIIDVGAGDSHFVDVLLEKGYHNITLVSSSFHLRRMRWVFEEKFRIKGITTYFHGAVDSEFDKNNWWKNESSLITCNNEYVKLVYYLFKY